MVPQWPKCKMPYADGSARLCVSQRFPGTLQALSGCSNVPKRAKSAPIYYVSAKKQANTPSLVDYGSDPARGETESSTRYKRSSRMPPKKIFRVGISNLWEKVPEGQFRLIQLGSRGGSFRLNMRAKASLASRSRVRSAALAVSRLVVWSRAAVSI